MNGFLSENSEKSLTRLLSLIACLTACALAITQEVLHAFAEDFQRDNSVIGILLTFAGATKVSQKFAEYRNKKKNEQSNKIDIDRIDVDLDDSDS